LEREKGEYIVWPAYFDTSLSRRLGRKVPLNEATRNPTINDILEACKELKLECEVYEEAKYPRVWYLHKGYVRIKFSGPKSKLLHILAKKINQIRSHESTSI